ncbi:MAG: restriction endonuclease subunit S [Aphanizomenon sp.]|jgi:type I restriction enzyme S subunit
MKLETFFKHFDLLAEAPNGVQKLRELILDLAVRGKLVPQDANDEPAAVLLERIKKEKERLVSKKKKNIDSELIQPIKLNEISYKLPSSWEWTRLGSIINSLTGGGTPSKNNPLFWGGDIPWASVKDLKGNKYLTTTIDYITEKGLHQSSSNFILKGKVIICTRMGLGKIAINTIDVAINQDLKAIELAEGIDVNYFYNFYLTQNIVGTGVTVSGIRQSELINFLVPIPPLAEQKRIVTKVDELMKLCDELEARQKKKQETRILINNAALNKLLTADTPETFTKNWQRIGDNFDLLYSAPENIGKLRQAILQLAVMGKLVPQNANDEPAAVLLERIKKEKERLVKEGKVKKEKSLPAIKDDEIPFDLPIGWEWVRVIDIVDIGTGSTPATTNPEYYGGNIPWYTSSATNNYIAEKPQVFITEKALKETNCKIFPSGSLIIALYGQGKTRGQISEIMIAGATNQAIAAMVFFESSKELKKYIKYYFLKIYDEIRNLAEGGAQPNLNVGKIKNTLIPIPPFNEQKRIVTKVDKLMKLCDELETKLTQTQTEREKIINAAVKQLLTV